MIDWPTRWRHALQALYLPTSPEPALSALLVRYREPQRCCHSARVLAGLARRELL